MAGRAIGWTFTWNNPTRSGPDLLKLLQATGATYSVFQHERGESGTPHYQGYIHFKAARRFDAVKKILPLAHWQEQKGNAEHSIVYCTKQDTRIGGPWTFGSAPAQGNHLKDATTALAAGKTMREVAQDLPDVFTLYASGLYKFQRTLGQGCHPTLVVRQNWLFYGSPGSGKSYRARLICPDAYVKRPNKWFEFYSGETESIWDDYGAGWAMPLAELLQLLDGYYTRVEVKGGEEHWLSTTNIITSNVHPLNWYDYKDRNVLLVALARRFSGVYVFTARDRELTEILGADEILRFFTRTYVEPDMEL